MHDYGVYPAGDTLVDERERTLTNFSVHKPRLFCAAEDGHTPEMLRVQVRHLGRRDTVDLDLRDPELFRQIQRAVPTCKILKSGACARVEAYILELQTESQPKSPPLYFRQHGICCLSNGTYVFVAGDEVLNLPKGQKYAIAPEVARAHLVYDAELSSGRAVKAFWEVLERDDDVVLPVFGFTLGSTFRSQLSALGCTTYPSLVVVGKQSFGKTTVCQRFGLLFNDTKRAGRFWAQRDLKSTAASTIETISQYRDQVVLLDDMAKSVSPSEVYKRREILGDTLRFASNETERSKMNSSQQVKERLCTAGVMFTSESNLDNESDISRTITVHIRREMHGGDPRDREVAATVFRYFLLWLLPKLDEAIDDLRGYLGSITGPNQRLQKNRMLILWALALFMDFAQDQEVASRKKIADMFKGAVKIMDGILNEQIKRIHQLESTASISHYILSGIQDGVIEQVSEEDMEEAAEEGRILPYYHYIRPQGEPNKICIRTDVLYRYLTNETPLRFSSDKKMDEQLIREKVVYPGSDGRVAATRIDGKRYLGMWHADLVGAAASGN